jgi:putative Ca2+/H+ antiporter (TMEM165/GDT1 family)
MEAFLISLSSVATAEMGDRTQLLALTLAACFRMPWPIVMGVVCATIANHAAAGLVGAWVGQHLRPVVLDLAVGVSMVGMALWTLKPDKLEEQTSGVSNAGGSLSQPSGGDCGYHLRHVDGECAGHFPRRRFCAPTATQGHQHCSVPTAMPRSAVPGQTLQPSTPCPGTDTPVVRHPPVWMPERAATV